MPRMSPTPETTPLTTAQDDRAPLPRLLERVRRHRYLLAVLSFAAGAASFLLMTRNERLAPWVAALLVCNWIAIVFEGALGRWLARYRFGRLAPHLLRYGMQSGHQTSFFFCLPFVLSTTTWDSGQALFALLTIAAALASMWDPLYYGVIAARPWLHLAFHGLAMYLALLVVPPLIWQFTTTQSLALASAALGLLAAPSFLHLVRRRTPLRLAGLLAAAFALGGLSWIGRYWVPPATLWISEARLTPTLDPDRRAPGIPLQDVPAGALAQGVYAYAAIHAPRGLRERVFHVWRHQGRIVDRIALTIAGGREQGYRAWSYKRSFPENSAGQWEVDFVTDGDQLIGKLRFRVVPDAPPG
jgi:hypothetical protein